MTGHDSRPQVYRSQIPDINRKSSRCPRPLLVRIESDSAQENKMGKLEFIRLDVNDRWEAFSPDLAPKMNKVSDSVAFL